jgi:hypothetical protein
MPASGSDSTGGFLAGWGFVIGKTASLAAMALVASLVIEATGIRLSLLQGLPM